MNIPVSGLTEATSGATNATLDGNIAAIREFEASHDTMVNSALNFVHEYGKASPEKRQEMLKSPERKAMFEQADHYCNANNILLEQNHYGNRSKLSTAIFHLNTILTNSIGGDAEDIHAILEDGKNNAERVGGPYKTPSRTLERLVDNKLREYQEKAPRRP